MGIGGKEAVISIKSRQKAGLSGHKITDRALRLELVAQHFIPRYFSGTQDTTRIRGLCIMGLSIWVAMCHECAADFSLYLHVTGY